MKRFYKRVDSTAGADACWPWTGHRGVGGYGMFWLDRSNQAAHRVAWMLSTGKPIPGGMCVCHRCDNPPCCNPLHLWLGTNAENTADKVSKGRQACGADTKPHTRARGERQWLAKLTNAAVVEIRMAAARGTRTLELARKYQVDPCNIRRVVRGETWAHVQPTKES